MDKTLILEISSDDDVGFDDSSTADNFDWISNLFEDNPLQDDANCRPDDSDDVVVVGEVIVKQKRTKISMKNHKNYDDDDDDDDDCVVLDCDPDKPPPSKEGNDSGEDDSDELLIVGEKGQVACRDFPHSRHLCAKHPFDSTAHESRCDLCHCYVCDTLAPCPYWGSGLSSIDHCHATDKEEFWKLERKKFRQSRNTPAPITKPPVAAMPRIPQLPLNLSRAHLMRTGPASRVSTFGRPNIISQGRNPRPRIPLARTRFQPQLVSQQLLGTSSSSTRSNGSTQNNRGTTVSSSLAPMHSTFKRCRLTARPVMINNSVNRSPTHANAAHLQQWQPNDRLAGKPSDSSCITLTDSPCSLNLNVNTCQPIARIIPTNGLPSQVPGFGQQIRSPISNFLPSAVTSDSPYVYTSMNQTSIVSNPTMLHNSSNAMNSVTQSSQQPPSVVTHEISHPNFPCDTCSVPSNITGRSQQSLEAPHNLSSPNFSSCNSNPLNSFTPSCQQTSAQNTPVLGAIPQSFMQPSVDNLEVQGEALLHELLSPIEKNSQFLGSTNTSNLDLDIENWLSDNEHFLGGQNGSSFDDVNNQSSVTTAVDTGMLYFDFETSWKGLTNL